MMNRIWSRYTGMAAIGFGGIAALIYLLMINVTLAHIEAVSGQVPFDMRPFGYRPADAVELLDALGAEGRAYYLSQQIPLDTLYPATLALALVAAMNWFGRCMPSRKLVRVGIILSVCAAFGDYGENLGIIAMVRTWPDLPVPLVYATSTASIAKSVSTTLAVFLAILIATVWARLPKAEFRP